MGPINVEAGDAWERGDTLSATELAAGSDGTVEGSIDGDADASGEAFTEGADGTSDVATDAPAEPVAHSKDVIFDILKNERRRRTLEFLREEPTTTLSDLAEHVAALENDKTVRELTSSERKRVYVGLYQCHLPKMADAGVIDHDRSRGTVELRDETSPYYVYLDIEPGGGEDDDDGLLDGLRRRLTSTSSLPRLSTPSFLDGR